MIKAESATFALKFFVVWKIKMSTKRKPYQNEKEI